MATEESLPALAQRVIAVAREVEATIVTAESLTGGLMCAALTHVPGASDVIAGGVIAYSKHTKASLLGVNSEELSRHGVYSAWTAEQMARGALARSGATHAVAVTGVAGPGSSGSTPAGEVYLCVVGPQDTFVAQHAQLMGTREEIRQQTVVAGLELLLGAIAAH